MRPLLVFALLASAAAAQPDRVETTVLDDDATLTVRLASVGGVPGAALDRSSVVSFLNCGDRQRLTPLHATEGGRIEGFQLMEAFVDIQRPGGRRDTIHLDTTCLFAPLSDEYPFSQATPVRAPLSGGWLIASSHGDGDGYAGNWIVGRAWEPLRSGAPVTFQDAEDHPIVERLRTEAVLLAEGTWRQQETLRACAAADESNVCTDPVVRRAHDRWLRALGL